MTIDDPRKKLSELTERQREVLRLVCQGMDYKSVADNLVVAEATVKSHMGNIYLKLGIDNLSRSQRKLALFQVYCPVLQDMPYAPDSLEPVEPEAVPPDRVMKLVEEDDAAIIPYQSKPAKIIKMPEPHPPDPPNRGCSRIWLGLILGIGIIGVILYALWRSGIITIGTPPTPTPIAPIVEEPVDDQSGSDEEPPTPTSEPEEEDVPPTSTPHPTSTPLPTSTPPPPTEIPTLTPIPNTQGGTILKVGETWIQDGVYLTLRDVELTSEHDGEVYLKFDVGNFTGSDINVSFYAGDLTLIANNGERFEPSGGPNSYSVETATWNEVIKNGERKDVWFWHTRRPSWLGNIFAPDFSYLTITVRNWSLIGEAVWETR